jgi:autophagy-related protein 2
VVDGYNVDQDSGTELAQWVSKPESKNKGVVYELEAAHWFDNENRELKPHHVPIPTKQSRLTSKVINPTFDIEVNLKTLTFRLFDGYDFVYPLSKDHQNINKNDNNVNIKNDNDHMKKQSMITNHYSEDRKKPIDLLSHATSDYFDSESFISDDQSTASFNSFYNDDNNRKHYEINSSNEKNNNKDRKMKNTRKTEKVVEVSFSNLQFRYSENFNKMIHLYLVSDFIVSQCLNGRAQNVLYEWKRYSQANEELDSRGNLMRMLTLDMSTQRKSSNKNNNEDEEDEDLSLGKDVSIDVRIRPMRCCATWDLVDFLRWFATPFIQAAAAKEERFKHEEEMKNLKNKNKSSSTTSSASLLRQIKTATIHPITLKIDFDTRLIDLEAVQQGDLLELLKLFPLRGVELDLRPVSIENNSFLKFGEKIGQYYIEDLTSSQLIKFVAGAAPLRPISAIGSTAANLILLPLEQYKIGSKNGGKILYGLKKGSLDFVKTLALESVRASLKISSTITSTLRFLVDNGNSSSSSSYSSRGGRNSGRKSNSLSSKTYNTHNQHSRHNIIGQHQPVNIHSGLHHAQQSMRVGLSEAAHAIIAVPMDDFQRGNTKGAIKSAIKAVPIAVLSPMIGASEALSYTFLGIRNSMNPEIMHDEKTRYDI